MKPGRKKGTTPAKKNAGISLSVELIDYIDSLPQVKSPTDKDGWSRSYFVEQVLRNHLGLPADYNESDLRQIIGGGIIV